MSFDNDNMIGTIPPGFLAPADGNYAPNGAQSAALRLQLFLMRADYRKLSDDQILDL
jgi:hypothetical protein